MALIPLIVKTAENWYDIKVFLNRVFSWNYEPESMIYSDDHESPYDEDLLVFG